VSRRAAAVGGGRTHGCQRAVLLLRPRYGFANNAWPVRLGQLGLLLRLGRCGLAGTAWPVRLGRYSLASTAWPVRLGRYGWNFARDV
jgi:hypothetical protein